MPPRPIALHEPPRMPAETPLPPPDRRNAWWWTSQMILRLVYTLWNGYRARGTERLAPGGGLLLINHQSFLDPTLVGLPLSRPVSFLARESLLRASVLGPFLRRVYVLPINREAAGTESLREAIRRMRHGFLVGIFPEGTRTPDGSLGEFKPGFVALVRRAGVPVYPVGVAGAFEALPKGVKFLRPRPIRVVFGEPFAEKELKGDPLAVSAVARDRIAACLAEAQAWLREGTAATGDAKQSSSTSAAPPE